MEFVGTCRCGSEIVIKIEHPLHNLMKYEFEGRCPACDMDDVYFRVKKG